MCTSKGEDEIPFSSLHPIFLSLPLSSPSLFSPFYPMHRCARTREKENLSSPPISFFILSALSFESPLFFPLSLCHARGGEKNFFSTTTFFSCFSLSFFSFSPYPLMRQIHAIIENRRISINFFAKLTNFEK